MGWLLEKGGALGSNVQIQPAYCEIWMLYFVRFRDSSYPRGYPKNGISRVMTEGVLLQMWSGHTSNDTILVRLGWMARAICDRRP